MSVTLTAQMRSTFGKEKAKKMRRAGAIPAVIYGAAKEPEHVTLDAHELGVLSHRVHGQTLMIDLMVTDMDGNSRVEKVFLRELQRDPVSSKIIHADILRVDVNKPITVEVSVVGVGVPAGVKLGGLLETLLHSVKIRCLPQNVPPHMDLDISGIGLGHSLHVSDVPWPDTIEVLTPDDAALFTVLGKRGMEDEAAPDALAAAGGAESAAAEPEVIGRKKKDDEAE